MNRRNKHSGRRCPCCGKPLRQEGHFCYKCCSFLDESDSSPLLPEQVPEQALTDLLEKSRAANLVKDATLRSRIAGKISLLAMICFVCSMVMTVFFDQWIMWDVVVALAALVLFGLSAVVDGPEPKTALQPEQCQLLFVKYIVPGVVREVFGEDADYDPEEGIEEQWVPDNLFGWDGFDDRHSSQRIRASYRGRPVEVYHVHVTRSHTRRNGVKRTCDVFKGYFLYTDTQIDPAAELRIAEKYFGSLHLREEEAVPEDFEKVFNVSCEDDGAVQEVLVPQLRQQLVELCKQCSGDIRVAVKPGGRMMIGIGDSDPEITQDDDPAELRALCQKRLAVLLKLLDLLLAAE